MFRKHSILLLLVIGMLCACKPRSVEQAQRVVAQADSLWHIGKMYGVDEGDSATLAQAYETLKDRHSSLFSFVLGPSSRQTYAHACYHYGKLLRAKDDPEEAMRCFINATHSDTRDYHILGRVYSNMGSICHLASEFSLSYDMYEKSANMFLQNGDTLLYYYGLNNMAYELAEQGKKDSCFNITENIRKISSSDSVLFAYCFMTQAQACLKCKQYDSLIFYAHKSKQYVLTMASSSLQLSQAYSYLGERDSAVYYALQVLDNTDELFDVNNALYILTNDDMSQDMDDIRETAAKRSDTQKLLEIRRSKMSQAVQILEQDINQKKNLLWLYAVMITIMVIGIGIALYVFNKRRKHQLLSQKINGLTKQTIEIQKKHEKAVDRYESHLKHREEEILYKCTLMRDNPQIAVELKWNDFDSLCNVIDNNFYLLTTKLRQKESLNETEIRLCILVLIGLNRVQIANTMPYAQNSIGKLKDQTAKKLGTTGKYLRDFLIKMIIDE